MSDPRLPLPALRTNGKPFTTHEDKPIEWQEFEGAPLLPGARAELLEHLERVAQDEGPMLLEPRGVYDVALMGHVQSEEANEQEEGRWGRKPGYTVAQYSVEACLIAIRLWLYDDDPHSDEAYTQAAEWYGFNTSGAWMGQGTPTFKSNQEDFDA